jgi:hypothetical protein
MNWSGGQRLEPRAKLTWTTGDDDDDTEITGISVSVPRSMAALTVKLPRDLQEVYMCAGASPALSMLY